MSTITAFSSLSAPTQFLQVKNDAYAYRRFGSGPGRPLLCLQHFMGTLENWDPAVTGPLAAAREVILFNNAGVGRSAGKVPATVAGMATHALNSWTAWEWPAATSSGSHSAEWSRSRWHETDHSVSAG
jgi:pimeloyl-ACP methyl ester carboxylesterase